MKKDIEIEEADEFDEAEEGEEEPIAEPDSQILPTLRREGWCISQVGFKLIVKDSKRIDINSVWLYFLFHISFKLSLFCTDPRNIIQL